jgi:mannose-1-phosphate guanylyltransferase/mannose-6-phosphate isomerase
MPSIMTKLCALILAGGSGTRFWPASRRAMPKQLLDLGGTGRSLVADTIDRVRPLVGDRVTIIATESLASAMDRELRTAGPLTILNEPVGRNTAPAIGLGAIHARAAGADLVAVLPSDHAIVNTVAFREALALAAEVALDGTLVTLGIRPTRVDTGFGHIGLGDTVRPGVFRVAEFVEKPPRERAEALLAGGRHVWNAGMFIMTPDAVLAELRRQKPAIAAALDRLADALARSPAEELALRREIYPSIESISIDYAVMEKAEKVAVIPADIGWSDVGSWAAAWELAEKSEEGNARRGGEAIFHDARGNLAVVPEGRVVALIGVHDLVVVETADALLVCPRERAQDVRAIVTELEKRKLERHL